MGSPSISSLLTCVLLPDPLLATTSLPCYFTLMLWVLAFQGVARSAPPRVVPRVRLRPLVGVALAMALATTCPQ